MFTTTLGAIALKTENNPSVTRKLVNYGAAMTVQ
jgi:hypothetical protein